MLKINEVKIHKRNKLIINKLLTNIKRQIEITDVLDT